jgi:hypothetical protein
MRTTTAKRNTQNAFLANVAKKDTFTENGAVSNSTTGKVLVDQFGSAGTYRGRDLNAVFADQARLWGENPTDTVRFTFYLRLITRKIKGFVATEKVQSGQGAKDETFKRLLWVAKYHADTFYKNLWLIPVVGSWKDIFTLVEYNATHKTDALDLNRVFELLQRGLENEYNRALVLKFLPSIKAASKCKTERAKIRASVARQFAKYLGLNPIQYRQMKATGAAHRFQTVLTQKLYDELNFNQIPGKALFNLVSGDFLKEHGLEKKYLKWLESQPTAKFTGYVYELSDKFLKNGNRNLNIPVAQKLTYDKQFKGLIELAKKNTGGLKGNVWVACDTSGSMNQPTAGGATTAINVAVSLAVYFAELNTGAFHNHVIMFDHISRVCKLTGDSFVDRIAQLPPVGAGDTNFQSVVDEIVRVRKQNPKIPIADYPDTILVVSDMQFNPAGGGYSYGNVRYSSTQDKTNYEAAMQKLAAVGLPPVKVVWWQVNARNNDFPSTIDDVGTYMVSGFDGAVISIILGGEKVKDEKTGKLREKTMEEKVQDALTQEVLIQATV